MRLASAILGLWCGALWCGWASAQGRDAAAAETLFRDGRKLMDQGKIAEACEKFQASQELDPGVGTLLNLASCYEKAGRTASAWAVYREAQGEAQKAGDKKRAELATKRANALEGTLAMLIIEVPPEAQIEGLTIQRGKVAIGKTAWGTPTPVDPGPLTITASAPGKQSWTKTVEIGSTGSTTVTIPVLEAGEATSEDASSGSPAVTPIEPTKDKQQPSSTQRTLGFVAIGVGVVGLGVGSYFGIRARSNWSDAKNHCSNQTKECDSTGLELGDQAGTYADISTIAFAVGGVGLASGIALWLTAPKARKEARTQFTVQVAPTWRGVSAHGTY